MKKVAILTNMLEFLPGYSLTGIIKDQVRMLRDHGHEVDLFVSERYHGEEFKDATLKPLIPGTVLKDYVSKNDLTDTHKVVIDKTAAVLMKELNDVPIVFTHDFVFTGWFLPFGQACKKIGRLMGDTRWLHWLHSIPTSGRDFWRIREFGPSHKLVFPNETDRLRVAEQYHGVIDDVRVIPHIKDLRSFFEFDEETQNFIKEYPGLMQNEIVQVYPASVDRLEAKRVREVIMLFSKIKKMGMSVFLVIANQWTTTRAQAQSVDHYKNIARRNGLREGDDFVFTSDYKQGMWTVGVPQRNLREMMMCANLFIFPTREESFGLVLPEAALASGALCVLNKSLTMQLEVSGFSTLYFDFGSYHMNVEHQQEGQYLTDVAKIIIGRMRQNETLVTRTFMRRKYNWDNLYNSYYAPIMAESETWT